MTSGADERDPANRDERLRPIAARIVRGWARQNIAAINADVDAVGRSAVETSSREMARLPTEGGDDRSEGLTALDVIIKAIEHPTSKRWSLFPGRSPRETGSIRRLAAIIEHERDAAMRRAMTLKRDRLRLQAADAAMEEALDLIELLEVGAAAVAREMAPDHPKRASMLRTEVAAALSVRRRDLQQMLIVLRQASATHDLLADGQAALVDALDRARNITIGAARTAVAARRAVNAHHPAHDERAGSAAPLEYLVARLQAAVDRRERD